MSLPLTILHAWHSTLRRRGRRPAVIDLTSNRTFDFHAIDSLASHHTTALHLPPGRALALALPNSADWFAWFLAARLRGHCLIPLDSAHPPQASAALARQLGASWIIDASGCTPLLSPPRPRRWHRYACLKLTSGTTGQPTPVPNLDQHLIADAQQVAATMGLRPSDRNLALIPLGHSYGLGNLVLPLILYGTSAAVAPAFLPTQIPTWTKHHHLTVFPTVPAVLQALTQSPSVSSLPGLRLIISAGAPLSPALATAFHQKFGLIPHNFYGSSETGGICYDTRGRASLTGTAIGRPLRGVTLTISPRGRIRVTSPAVAHPSRSFLLQDTGLILPDGSLRLLGRTSSLANIGGKKVSPREIEEVIRHLPGITDAACWIKLAHGRHYLAAAAEGSIRPHDLRHHLANRLPPWKIPRELHLLPAFPRSSRGKINLPALQSLVQSLAPPA